LSRLKKLQNSLHNQEYEALLVSQSENIRYLSSFSGSNGWLFITEKHAFLATDFRYIEQAKSQAPEFQIVKVKASTGPWLLSLAGDLAIHRIGFEDTVVSYADYQKLIAPLSKNASVITFMPANNIVEMLRIIKGTDEIENIRHAARLADDAIAFAATLIRTGVTEREIAWSIESIKIDWQPEASRLILFSSGTWSIAHASPGERILENGDPVVIDLGALATVIAAI
jgi:Xaa-Pro aminopeptidase